MVRQRSFLFALIALTYCATARSEPAPRSAVWIDARPVLREYIAGHVPAARPLVPETLRSADGGVPGKILPPEVLEVVFGRLGLESSRPIVVYGAKTDPDATWIATVLRLSGFDDVRVLDGGLSRWQAEGGVPTASRSRHATTGPRVEFSRSRVATLEEVRRAAAGEGTVILDVRPADQFEKGHIPRALNRPWTEDVIADGAPGAGGWKPVEALREAYAALGIGPDTEVIVYCNTGHMASFGWWTLRERLGFAKVRLYDGSWVEWSMAE